MPTLAWKNLLAFVTEANPRLVNAINVVLVVLLAHGLAQLTWALVPAPEPFPAPPPQASEAPARQTGSDPAETLARQLPQWHLFGRAEARQVAVPRQEEIPETKLKLTLRGLFASDDPDDSWAIVADPSGKENFYKVGSTLPGNATLKEIHPDRIVLERRGKYETLRLPKESLDLATRTGGAAERRGARARLPRSGGAQVSLRAYRDTLLNDPARVADLVRIAPVRKRGKFIGYSLQPGRDASLFAQYGLQPGDIVTAVNGVALDSPAKGLSILNELATADRLDLEIERGGRRRHVSLPVD